MKECGLNLWREAAEAATNAAWRVILERGLIPSIGDRRTIFLRGTPFDEARLQVQKERDDMLLLRKVSPVHTLLVDEISTIAKSGYDAIESALKEVSQTTDQSSGRLPQWQLNHKLNVTSAQLCCLTEGMQDIEPDQSAEISEMHFGPSDHMSSASCDSDGATTSSRSSVAGESVFSYQSRNTSRSSLHPDSQC
jgi:hypothetical protein